MGEGSKGACVALNAFFRKERAKVQSQVHTLISCEKGPHGRSCVARNRCTMHVRAALGSIGGGTVAARRTPTEGVRRRRRDHWSTRDLRARTPGLPGQASVMQPVWYQP